MRVLPWTLVIFLYMPNVKMELSEEPSSQVIGKNPLALLSRCITPPSICPNNDITFWLYTPESREDEPYQLDVNDPINIQNAPFIANLPVKVLIHGYTGHKDYEPNISIRPELLKTGRFNVISLDFPLLVQEPCYLTAAINVPLVSNCTAQMIDRIVNVASVPFDSIHVIGFSLGAQVAGYLSNYIETGLLRRITGLDPAMPLFTTPDRRKKLDASDAHFVDVLHTNAMQRGKLEPCGHVDFYANGGVTQPGCDQFDTDFYSYSSCYHNRAPRFYAESVNSAIGFPARKCISWFLYMLGLCGLASSVAEIQVMGEYTAETARGNFFFNTNAKPPYARGLDGAVY